MINPEHRNFLKAICSDPEDDLPRLIFADYLEESGEPALIARAEYIRTQIELHNGQLSHEEHERFLQKARVLRAQFRDELDQILDQASELVVRVSSFKGFPFRLETDLNTFLTLGRTMLQDLAPIQAVHLVNYDIPTPEDAADSSAGHSAFPAQMLVLPQSSYPSLLSASLQNIPRYVASFVIARFLQQTMLPRLTHLKIQAEDFLITDLMILASQLTDSGVCQTLTELDLSEHPWEDDAGYFLCSAGAFQNLTKLRLKGHRFSSETQSLLQRHFGERVIL